MMLIFLAENTAAESFVRLFAEMSPAVYALFILGILCCTIEIFTPGFGVFGISGIVLMVAAIVLRMLGGGDAYMLLYMVLIAVAVFLLCFLLLSRLAEKGKLGKTAIFNVGTSVPTDRTDGTKDFSYLIGQTGTTVNFLRPVGKAEFADGEITEVVAYNGFIDAGQKVKVLSVEGQKVVVEEIKEN